jgi:hypothetical protein
MIGLCSGCVLSGDLMRVLILHWDAPIDNDGRTVPGVHVECPKCGLRASMPDTGPDTIKRCAAFLRKNCLRGEKNIYSTEVFGRLHDAATAKDH